MGDKEGLKKHKEGANTKGRWRIPTRGIFQLKFKTVVEGTTLGG